MRKEKESRGRETWRYKQTERKRERKRERERERENTGFNLLFYSAVINQRSEQFLVHTGEMLVIFVILKLIDMTSVMNIF